MENAMKYIIYKLKFSTGVHFGNGTLDDTEYTFCADTLFSALCIEAVKSGTDMLNRLVNWAKSDRKSTRLNSSHTLASRMPSSA